MAAPSKKSDSMVECRSTHSRITNQYVKLSLKHRIYHRKSSFTCLNSPGRMTRAKTLIFVIVYLRTEGEARQQPVSVTRLSCFVRLGPYRVAMIKTGQQLTGRLPQTGRLPRLCKASTVWCRNINIFKTIDLIIIPLHFKKLVPGKWNNYNTWIKGKNICERKRK